VKRLFVFAALLAAAACGSHSPTAPTAPSSDAGTRVIALSGNLAFGNVTVGSTASTTLRIANTGTATLTVTAVQANGSISGVVHADVTGGAIAAGASRDMTVTFAPAAAQAYSGTLVVAGDQTSGTNTIAISGTGVAAAFSISGVVNDGTTGPSGRIAGATVAVTDGANKGKSVTTDANGQYVMTGLAAGAMTITASAADYSSVDKSVTLAGNLALDFSLTRNAAPPSNPGTPSNPGNPPSPPPPAAPAVEYRIFGTARSCSATYQNSTGGTNQAEVSIPFTYSWPTAHQYDFMYMSCQIDTGGDKGSITIELYKDGALIQSATAVGFPNIATVDGLY
jgi:hypothetical protein